MSTPKHYVLGAGQVGCLYDYGPNAHETLEDALADASWYLEDDAPYDDDMGEAFAQMCREAKHALRRARLYYFPAEWRSAFGDYIEITEQDGPCPEQDD